MEKKPTTKKVVATKKTVREGLIKTQKKTIQNTANMPYIPEMKCLASEIEIDYKTRTVLLLDARNDLVPMFFSGLDAMAANYESKAINFYVDFVYKTCKGFIEVCRDKSITFMEKKNPTFGIGDIVKNGKGKRRFIINLYIDDKEDQLYYTHVDPDNATALRTACTEKTMMSWVDKV